MGRQVFCASGESSCGNTVDNLCKRQRLIPKKFAFYFILLLRLKTKQENILIVILSIRTRDHLDREAFGSNGSAEGKVFGPTSPADREAFGSNGSWDREAFGRNGLPGGKVFGPTFPADREVQGGTVQRGGGSSGLTFLRIATPGPIGSLDHDVFGRIGSLKRVAAKSNGSGRGVRSAPRSTLHGPRVRALDASFLSWVWILAWGFALAFWPRDGGRLRARLPTTHPEGVSHCEQQTN